MLQSRHANLANIPRTSRPCSFRLTEERRLLLATSEIRRRIAVRLLLSEHEKKPLTVYTEGFRAYDPLEADDECDREYVVHGDGGVVSAYPVGLSASDSRIRPSPWT